MSGQDGPRPIRTDHAPLVAITSVVTSTPFTDARNRPSELLDVIGRPDVLRQLAESHSAVDAGDVLDTDELAALMAKRTQKAR